MDVRFFLLGGLYPAVEPEPEQMLLMTRGGGWTQVAAQEIHADAALAEVSFEAFRVAVEALGGVLPEFL